MTTAIVILAGVLILITFSRYIVYLKRKLKESSDENNSILQRNYTLVDQLNAIESKIQDTTVNEGDRIVPLMPGNYRFTASCNSVIIGCEAGCKSFEGGEVKHHKDCKYYPDSLSKYYDELHLQNEDLTDKINMLRKQNFAEFMGNEFERQELTQQIEHPEIDWKERCQKIMDWIIMPQMKAAERYDLTIKVPAFYPELQLPAGYYRFPEMEYFPISPKYDYQVSEPEESEYPIEAFERKEYNPFTKQYDIDPHWNWGEREFIDYMSKNEGIQFNEKGFALPVLTDEDGYDYIPIGATDQVENDEPSVEEQINNNPKYY